MTIGRSARGVAQDREAANLDAKLVDALGHSRHYCHFFDLALVVEGANLDELLQ